MDQVGKEKNMNYGSAFDEKSGWGKMEGKNMDQNFINMWVKKLYKKILNCGSGR